MDTVKKYKFLSARERFEIRIYTLVGIKQFRKIVFMLEKVVHLKDKGTNINYHIARMTPNAIVSFKKYLFYNGSIHARNILYAVIYAVFRMIFGHQVFFWDYFVLVNLIKDIYCIMLQRYNYLYIKNAQASIETKRKRWVSRQRDVIKKQFEEAYTVADRERDLQLLQDFKTKLNQDAIIVIDRNLAETLDRLERATVKFQKGGNAQ